MPNSELVQISTYLESSIVTKIIKKRGKKGLISSSAYLRTLVYDDLGMTEKK